MFRGVQLYRSLASGLGGGGITCFTVSLASSQDLLPRQSNFHSSPAMQACTRVSEFSRQLVSSHGANCVGECRCARGFAIAAEDRPWHDKIGHNLGKGSEHVINQPVDELSEHVNITNEIEKELAAAENVDAIMGTVAQHEAEFEGPNIATALVALQHLTESMSAEECIDAVHQKPQFKTLLNLVDERLTFDVFTLTQTLQALTGLHVQDEQLLNNISSRLTGLVQASDAKQLLKLIKGICKSGYFPTRDLLEAIHRRVEAIKGTVHPETCSDVERAVTKLATRMSEGMSKNGNGKEKGSKPPTSGQQGPADNMPQQPDYS